MKIYIAFYKANYKWWGRLIKWWTNGQYTYCEIYANGKLIGISENENVRIKKQKLNKDKWDLVEMPSLNYSGIIKFLKDTRGYRYDWKGIILSNIFNTRMHSILKYTCSEWVAECIDKQLDIIEPKNYSSLSPNDLYKIIKKCSPKTTQKN